MRKPFNALKGKETLRKRDVKKMNDFKQSK